MLKAKEIDPIQASKSGIADAIEALGHTPLRVRDLEEFLGVSNQSIYRLAAAQVIPHFRVGNNLRFDPKAIAAWIRSRSINGM